MNNYERVQKNSKSLSKTLIKKLFWRSYSISEIQIGIYNSIGFNQLQQVFYLLGNFYLHQIGHICVTVHSASIAASRTLSGKVYSAEIKSDATKLLTTSWQFYY